MDERIMREQPIEDLRDLRMGGRGNERQREEVGRNERE
jgi:hypothetical protein